MAPAGSAEGFYGAVHAGADAVYLGGSRFSARAYAENFTEEELTTCIRYGKLMGVRVYLAVNTLLKEDELWELTDYLRPFCQAGLDGVIVQDLGVLGLIRECFPGLRLHASTQMTLCSSHGARLLKEMGVSRIVPARELSLEELAAMRKEADVELETFIHGAMCYCYSGQCLFSSILGGRSGNRGRCAQPCRLPYTVMTEDGSGKAKEPAYPLSMKDMCTVDHLPALIEAGIDSFKIEGRMKRPEYAAGVTAVYRKYIDLYYDLRDKLGAKEAARAYRVDGADRQLLNSLYIRSKTQEGYYFQKNGPQMITVHSPAYTPTDETLLSKIRKEHLEERARLSVKAEAVFLTGQPAQVILRRGEAAGRAVGEIVQRALKQPITEENLKKQLGRLGDSPFIADKLRIQVGKDAFYPLKQINELRRQAVRELEQALLAAGDYRPNGSMKERDNRPSESTENFKTSEYLENTGFVETDISENSDKTTAREDENSQYGWSVSVRTYEQLDALTRICSTLSDREICLKRIYVDGDLLTQRKEEILGVCREFSGERDVKLFLALPYVIRKEDESYLMQLCRMKEEGSFAGFLIRSLDGLGYLKERGVPCDLRTDAGVYVWNAKAAGMLSPLAQGFCIPYELKASEQRRLLDGIGQKAAGVPCEKIVYSRIPMMITANCVLKTAEGCKRGEAKEVWLTDRYQKEFPVQRNCLHCFNIIYNSLPFALPAEVSKWQAKSDLRLDFTVETADETEKILKGFWQNESLPEGLYTTGLERRGAE